MFSRLGLRTIRTCTPSVHNVQVRTGFFDRFKPFTNDLPPPEVTVEQWNVIPQLFQIIIDVREPHEREVGFIENDFNVPLGTLPSKLADIKVQMNGAVVLCYCKGGVRSAAAAKMLRDIGIEAWNLKGGFTAYKEYKEAVANGTYEQTLTQEDAIEHIRNQALLGHKVEMLGNKN